MGIMLGSSTSCFLVISFTGTVQFLKLSYRCNNSQFCQNSKYIILPEGDSFAVTQKDSFRTVHGAVSGLIFRDETFDGN